MIWGAYTLENPYRLPNNMVLSKELSNIYVTIFLATAILPRKKESYKTFRFVACKLPSFGYLESLG